jgi:acetolactate synthase-1/2/3 large subunit
MKMTVADLVLKYLEMEGVEYIFGVPGTTLEPLFMAFNRNSNVKPILTKHEEGAAFMADGYARIKGSIGACFGISGPGATNLVSGVANAFVDNVPILVLTGEVATNIHKEGSYQNSTKSLDSVSIFQHITKSSSILISKNTANEDIHSSIRIALTEKKGPVHLGIPTDVLSGEIDDDVLATYRISAEYFDRRRVIDAANELVHANSPMILIGAGAIASGACQEIQELAEMLSIPVATTPKAKGAFPEDHPLSLGVFGLCGSPLAEKYIKSSQIDVLLVIGASLDKITTSMLKSDIVSLKTLIHINIDSSEIGKNYQSNIPLVGDARIIVGEISIRVLRDLINGKNERKNREEMLNIFRREVGIYRDSAKLESNNIPVKPQRVIRELQEVFPQDAILFVDAGNHLFWTIHYMKFQRNNSFIAPFGMFITGYATAAAVGGKLAAGDRPVVALVGDGCFQMNGMEVATAVNYNIPVVWIIQNNAKLALVDDFQKLSMGNKSVATTFKQVDFAKFAQSLGAEGYRIDKPNELKELLPKIIEMKKPTVVDCLIDPNEIPPWPDILKDIKSIFTS